MAGPLAGPAVGREGLAARVGLAAAFWFSAKFVTMCFPPNRLTRKTPTLHLPWRRPRREEGRRPDAQAGRRNERRRRNMKEKKGDKTERKQKEEKTEKESKRRNTYPRAGRARPKARPALL